MMKRWAWMISGALIFLLGMKQSMFLKAAEVVEVEEVEVEATAPAASVQNSQKTEEKTARITTVDIQTSDDRTTKVHLRGENLPKPTLQRLSKGRFLIKFPKTRLDIPGRVPGKGNVEAVRSAMHEGMEAWVVADTKAVSDFSLEKAPSGWILELKTRDEKGNVVAPDVQPQKEKPVERKKVSSEDFLEGQPNRLIQLTARESDREWKLILTGDGPLQYTLRKLQKPEKLVLRLPNTRMEISDRQIQSSPKEEAMVEKGGVLALEPRQIGSRWAPTTELILTLRPQVKYAVERQLNQLILTFQRNDATLPSVQGGDLMKEVSLDVTGADLVSVLKTLGTEAGFDVDIETGVSGTVTETITRMPLKSALALLLAPGNYVYDVQGNVLRIGTTANLLSAKQRLPQKVEVLPAGGMNAAQVDSLVRAVLDPTNAVQTTVDTQRNALILKGTPEDIAGYKRTIRELNLSVSGDERIMRVVNLNYLTTDRATAVLTPYLTPQGQIQVDVANQTLILREVPENMDVLLELLAELDVKPSQVLIESTIVEVTAEKTDSFGVDWSASRSQDPTLTGSLNQRTTAPNPGEIVFGTVRSGWNIDAMLQALTRTQDAKIISKPRIATSNNVAASIQTIEEVVFISLVQTFPQGSTVPVLSESIQTIQLPISLQVTPRITSDGQITTQINASIRSISGPPPQSVLGGAPPPPTTTQTASTTLTIKDGETIVIGGLVRDVAQERVNKIPLLGSLPILGGLFRNTEKTNRKVELVIFITPKLLEA